MAIQIPAPIKAVTARVSLLALAGTFDLASKWVRDMQDEIAGWEDGRRVAIGVLPKGPCVTIQKVGGRIRYIGKGSLDPAVSILFKNMDSALLIFMALLGAAQAVAENRICVHGDNSKAMQVTRAMAVVQTYLFPGFMLKKTFKRPPKLNASQMATKGLIMCLLPLKLVGGAFR